MTLDTLTLFRRAYPTSRTVNVAAGALQAAIDAAQPGDRLVLAAGTYGYSQFYGKRGTPTAWITIEGQAGAVIDLSGGMNGTDGLDVQQSCYIAIYGLEVKGVQSPTDVNPSGIGIFRGSFRIAVWNCDVHDWPGGGINCFYIASSVYQGQTLPAGGWDGVDLVFNRIHATSRYSEFNTSGISFYGAEDLTPAIDGYGYRAIGNHVYDVLCTKPYTPGGFTDVTDGNGISPDSLAVPNNLNPNAPVYLKRGLIEGNLIAACGGRAVHIYNTKNVDVLLNTLVGNLRTNSPYINGSAEVDLQLDTADAANGVNIVGNVLAPMNTAKTLDPTAQSVTGNVVLGGTDTVTAGNIDARAAGLAWFATVPTLATLIAGMAALSPASPTPPTTPRRAGTAGYQARAAGGRNPSTVTVGALEPSLPARPFH
jgi:hypothetical protein